MRLLTEVQTAQERLRAAFWFPPAVGVLLGLALGEGLSEVPVSEGGLLVDVGWPGDAQSARDLLGLLAGSVMTVTSLSFSLTVLALQLASSQFSPRLLRTFAQDSTVKWTLAVFLGTFAYSLVVLRGIAGSGDLLPHAAMLGAFAAALLTVATLVRFIAHIVTLLRVDTMMANINSEALAALRRTYPERGADRPRRPETPADARPVEVHASGFVQAVNARRLVAAARERDLVLLMDVTPGDHVVHGVPVARVWRTGGGPALDAEDLPSLVTEAIEVGYERTGQQDVAFGFRQLADIAVRAMSPGINDPTTAIHATGHMASLLSALMSRDVVAAVHVDEDDVPRVVTRERDAAYLLSLACAELRRAAKAQPSVLVAMLGMLRDVGIRAATDAHREAVGEQVDLVVRASRRGVEDESEQREVEAAAESARAALRGQWRAPDGDRPRAGEAASA
jgi:uncharacterized membrane protein